MMNQQIYHLFWEQYFFALINTACRLVVQYVSLSMSLEDQARTSILANMSLFWTEHVSVYILYINQKSYFKN